MFDFASYFFRNTIIEFSLKRCLKLKYSGNYYPQGNLLEDSTNKNFIKRIKRIVDQNQRNQHKAIVFSLWAERITQKVSIGTSHFQLVYGKGAILPPNLALHSLTLVQYIEEKSYSPLQLRMSKILKLEEERDKARQDHSHHQQLVKSLFDESLVNNLFFEITELVLKWDKAREEKGKHTKFQKLWLGPFHIIEKLGPSTFILRD